MSEISIDVGSFLQDKATLEDALATYSSYSKDFLIDVISQLEPFNSDFISKMIKVLDNMKDTKAPKLVEALQGYAAEINAIAEGFSEFDTTLADSIK
jgi:hypothetical protein